MPLNRFKGTFCSLVGTPNNVITHVWCPHQTFSQKLQRKFTVTKDLEYFSITIENAIKETIKEAEELANYLANLINNNHIGLDNIFKPLDDLEFREIKLSQQKAKRRWLRLYAIKIETQCYVITGGTIKLTHKNQDREHTREELLKLKKCKNYFETEGVFDSDSLGDLFQ